MLKSWRKLTLRKHNIMCADAGKLFFPRIKFELSSDDIYNQLNLFNQIGIKISKADLYFSRSSKEIEAALEVILKNIKVKKNINKGNSELIVGILDSK